MNKFKKIFAAGIIVFLCTQVFAGIKFGDADINQNDEILYTVKHDIPGTSSYRSLFRAKIVNGEISKAPEILSCFPEQMELISGSSIIQIRNRYGTVWYNTITKSFVWKESRTGIPLNSMRLAKTSVAPGGNWICYTEKTDYATGKLWLENVNTGKKFLLDGKSSFAYESVPVKWISDGSILVYQKNNTIYFCNPDAVGRGVEVSEEFRKIGPGTINSVNWVDGRYLIYIDADLVYKINSKELYTLGLYSGIIGKGQTIGRLPSQFQANKDFFSVNKDVSSMIFVQNGKIFTYYKINKVSGDYLEVLYSGPYIDLKASLLESEIIWNEDNHPYIWMRRLPYNGDKIISSVYRVDEKLTKFLEAEDSGLPAISPDGKLIAFYSGTTVHAYETKTWKRINKIEGENIVSLLWENNSVLVIGGDKTIRRWNISDTKAEFLMVSSCVNGYWDTDSGLITADTGNGKIFTFNENERVWVERGESTAHSNTLRNGRYRLFCGETPNAYYDNALYIRTLTGKPVTKPAYPESIKKTGDRKKVALAFDAYDNADGLTRILSTLHQYNLKGTFFLNGEFIRRYKNETKQIALSGNECASMFFSTAKLTQEGFVLNEDYIRRGLARNEDEFNSVTGKELSLMWHAPYYSVTEAMKKAGLNAGYVYADPCQVYSDSVTLENAVSGVGKYLSPAELINSLMESIKINEGGIVPVTTGISRGTRESYLYDNLDLLLSAILDAGYEIVPLRYIVEK